MPPSRALLAAALLALLAPTAAAAAGARHFKSGTLSLSGDGRSLWLANELGDEIAVLDTWTEEAGQHLLHQFQPLLFGPGPVLLRHLPGRLAQVRGRRPDLCRPSYTGTAGRKTITGKCIGAENNYFTAR